MKFNTFIAIISSSLLFSGCASAPKPTWKKAGVSKNDTYSAIQKCKYNVGIAKINSEKERALIRACLESEGFRYTSRNVK